MRVLSLLPALFFAATGLAVAVPGTPSVPALPTLSGSSCVPSGAAAGDDTAVRPIIAIVQNATTYIQPLSGKLTSFQSGTPDVNAVVSVVAEIDAIIAYAVVELKAAAQVNLAVVDLTNLGVAIYALVALVLTVLNALVAIVLALAGGAVGTLQAAIVHLLQTVATLVVALHIFVAGALAVVLGPLLLAVSAAVQLLLSIVVKLNVLVAA